MKKFLNVLLAAALTLMLAAPAFAIVPAPENGYVGDYAEVLSDETERHIIAQNDKLSRATGGAIVVVTVDFMDGMDSADYAVECFNTWGIGNQERNNGMLLVYAVGENKVRAITGAGIENALSASTLEYMLEDYFYEGYDEGRLYDSSAFDGATLAFFDEAYAWYDTYYGGIDQALESGSSALAEPVPQDRPVDVVVHRSGISMFELIFILLVILVIADSFRYRRYYRRYVVTGMRPRHTYIPLFFGRPYYHHDTYHTNSGSYHRTTGGFGGGFSSGSGSGRSGGGFSGGSFGGGFSRGGGAGR